MRIGELAEHVGVNTRTIRYYESIGLLPDVDRSSAGCRIYSKDDVERVAFIRRAQRLDLTLDEIREVLALRERGERPCGYVLDVAHVRLGELDRRIAEMQHAREELRALLQRAGELPDDGCYGQLIQHQ
ncbi:heavy metal-responsive transcriptional regulator [Phytoactinopolyspora halotolerans]|nr:heavy metal-responsive transcriptional regulator [Phytoactinopolyspora halotolerans]